MSYLASQMQNWQMTIRASSALVSISNSAPSFCLHHSDNFSASNASTRTPLSAAGNSHMRHRRCNLDIITTVELDTGWAVSWWPADVLAGCDFALALHDSINWCLVYHCIIVPLVFCAPSTQHGWNGRACCGSYFNLFVLIPHLIFNLISHILRAELTKYGFFNGFFILQVRFKDF